MALCSEDSQSFICEEEGGNKKGPPPTPTNPQATFVFHLWTKSGYLLPGDSSFLLQRAPPQAGRGKNTQRQHEDFSLLAGLHFFILSFFLS